MPSDYVFVPLIVNVVPPQWLPDGLRGRNWEDTCEGQAPICRRILDPELMTRDCQTTSFLHQETRDTILRYQKRYEGVVNPAFYSSLLMNICERHEGLCSQIKYRGSRRKKRAVFGIILAVALTLGMVGATLGGMGTRGAANLREQIE